MSEKQDNWKSFSSCSWMWKIGREIKKVHVFQPCLMLQFHSMLSRSLHSFSVYIWDFFISSSKVLIKKSTESSDKGDVTSSHSKSDSRRNCCCVIEFSLFCDAFFQWKFTVRWQETKVQCRMIFHILQTNQITSLKELSWHTRFN